MCSMTRLMPIARALLCLFSCCCTSNNYALVRASNDVSDINCPGPDEAFVTTCSGSGNQQQQQEQQQPKLFDESDSKFGASDSLDEVLGESRDDRLRSQKRMATNEPWESSSSRSSINDKKGQSYCDPADDATTAMQQLKHTTDRLIQRYYNPFPRQGKCAIGSICGFAASRMSLGVANRIFRLSGATWVLSEVLYSSGFCDEEKCVPDEARPWIGILRRMLVKQCVKVRLAVRRLWNKERIREISQRDEVFSGGFAAGAFIGFVV